MHKEVRVSRKAWYVIAFVIVFALSIYLVRYGKDAPEWLTFVVFGSWAGLTVLLIRGG